MSNPSYKLTQEQVNVNPVCSKSMLIFILRNIFEIPFNKLTDFSVHWTSAPEDCGIKLCDKCNGMVDKVNIIHEEIQEAMRKYSASKIEIIELVRKSSGRDPLTGKTKLPQEYIGLSEIIGEAREFANSHDYGTFSYPFHVEEFEEAELISGISMEPVSVEVKTEPMEEMMEGTMDNDPLEEVGDVVLSKVEVEEEEDGDSEWEGDSEGDLDSAEEEEGEEDMEEDEDDASNDLPRNTRKNVAENDPVSPFPQNTPSVSVRRKNLAEKHEVDHSKQRQGHFCVCGKHFRNNGGLTLHIRYYTEECKFSCELCPKKYIDLGKLRRHMFQTHDTKMSGATSGCIDCGAVFADRKAHNNHRRMEHGVEYRHKKAPHGEDKMNSSEDSFQCLCGRSFVTSAIRLEHINHYTTTFMYKFKCDICKSKFRSHKSLDAHVNKFHRKAAEVPEVADITCPECGESFKIAKIFQLHMHKVHDKLNCKANQSTTNASSSISKLHGVRPLTPGGQSTIGNCPRCICGSSFSTEERLRKHIERMLPTDPLK